MANKKTELTKDRLIERALNNINNDRARISSILSDLVGAMDTSSPKQIIDEHATIGITLAKYFESLQRSNEQLVKIVNGIKDGKVVEDSEIDSNNVYELIKSK